MYYRYFLLSVFSLTSLFQPLLAQWLPNHDFLTEKYDQLHASPTQEKFRKLAPMPAGVVYIQHPDEGEEEIRWHFRTMKELGYNSLKGIYPVTGWTVEQIQLLALEEGIIPWWYGQGGWEEITEKLLKKLKIDTDLPMAKIREHPKMMEYQHKLLKDRVERTITYLQESGEKSALQSSFRAHDPTIGARGLDLTEEGERLFLQWAEEQYGTIEELNEAYNVHHANLKPVGGEVFQSWDDFAERWEQSNHREYRVKRDVMRFKADHALNNIQQVTKKYQEFYPHAPFRAGGELGLFLPQSWYGVDLEGIAEVMKDGGTLYPSMHFSWHYGQVDNELVRPFYMQASFMADLFKGGWSAAWESTGGPQQFDGEKDSDEKGFYVDEGTITQFYLTQLASGFRGFGIWCWSIRSAGKEGGEYSLLDRNNQVTPRARKLGQIGKALNRYRDELWEARKEPLVGVLYNWDNEGIWAAMSVRQRDAFRMQPIEARVGVSRTLINANVPFEYVTASDLRNGLAPRYPIIYLPAHLAINRDLLDSLYDYVQQGGRLVMDMPSGWYDAYSKVMPSGKDSKLEQIFGVTLDDYQFSGFNRSFKLDSLDIYGAFVHMTPTTAQVKSHFDHGKPAITENKVGKGTAVIIGYDASLMTFKPGNTLAEEMLLYYTLDNYSSPYSCDDAIVYRLTAPEADHYVLVNDGSETQVRLDTKSFQYQSVEDAITGESLELGSAIELPAHNARWLRYLK